MTTRGRRFCRRRALVAAFLVLLAACGGAKKDYPVLEPEGGTVRVDLRSIDPESGRFFTYRSPSGRRADYLVYREKHGDPRAVLAACRDCYRWKQGYRLDGNGVICNKCGMRFGFEALKEGIGSCVPMPLPATQEGEYLLIPVTALEEGTQYF